MPEMRLFFGTMLSKIGKRLHESGEDMIHEYHGVSRFRPHININTFIGLTEVVFEDAACVSKPLFEGTPHYIDELRAMDDNRLVGVNIWVGTPLEPDEAA